MTLKQTEDICRANEKAHEGAAAMKEDKQVADTNAIYNQRKKLYPKPNNRDINRQTQRWPNRQSPNSQQPCKFCLQLHPCGAQNCPDWCKTCLKCGKRNHFKGSTVCQGNVNNAINRLQIAKLDKPSTYSCNEISTIQLPHGHTSNHKQPEENKFIQDYPEFFNGLGDIEIPPINIKLKPETHHTVLPHHVTFQYPYLRQ